MNYIVYCDGGNHSHSNTGMYGSFKIMEHSKNYSTNRTVIHRVRQPLGDGTNNMAEYLILIETLKVIRDCVNQTYDFPTVPKPQTSYFTIYSDSQLVVKTVNGHWMCHKEHIALLRDKAQKLMVEIEEKRAGVKIKWVSRNEIVKVLGH
jgi:ribonuclease HI